MTNRFENISKNVSNIKKYFLADSGRLLTLLVVSRAGGDQGEVICGVARLWLLDLLPFHRVLLILLVVLPVVLITRNIIKMTAGLQCESHLMRKMRWNYLLHWPAGQSLNVKRERERVGGRYY